MTWQIFWLLGLEQLIQQLAENDLRGGLSFDCFHFSRGC